MNPSSGPVVGPVDGSRPLRAGRTSLREAPELAAHFHVPSLWVKDESENPFGTHKDRQSAYVVARAMRRPEPTRPHTLCILTSGNAGLSLASFASPFSVPVTALVDERLIADDSLFALRRVCRNVVSIDLRRRWRAAELRRAAGGANDDGVVDATNCAEAYGPVVDELAPQRPDVLVLPVGGGGLFLGVYRRLRALGWSTRLVGVTVSRSRSIADKLYAPWSPYHAEIRRICRPPSRHRLVDLPDDLSIALTWARVRTFCRCEPSSAAAFDVLRVARVRPSDRIIVVNTGSGRHPLLRPQWSLPG